MVIDGQLVLTFLETIVFFGILGWAVDVWMRTKQVYLYPAYGIIAFSVLAVPAMYLFDGFRLPVVWTVYGLIIGAGVVGTIRFGLIRRLTFNWQPQALFIGIFAVGLVILSLVQASKYSIPGGIDSAIHSSIIQGIISSGASLPGTYPLGMHVTIFSLEEIFNAQQELVFLSLYILLFLSTLASVALIADRMTKRPLAGYLALAVGCIDVSLFNNYLNGSGTHVVAIAFTAFLLLAPVVLSNSQRWTRLMSILGVLTAIWYFHYPTIFFALPLLWAWRVGTRQKPTWDYMLAIGLSLVISLPLQLKLVNDPLYVKLLGPGLAGIVAVELILKFGGNLIQRFLWRRATLTVIAAGSVWLFYHYSSSFLFIPTWYGVLIIRLALAGVLVAVLTRNIFSVVALISFAILSIMQAVIQTPWLIDHSSVMVELFYYFGFTVSLMLLGTAGAVGVKQLILSRRWQQLIIGVVTLYAMLIVVSRSFDQKYINTILPNDRPVSRYESSGGFGIFYTKNDAALAAWVKTNVHDQLIIANPGGLYNSWSPLTGNPSLWATYNVPTVAEPEPYIASLKQILRGEADADVDLLLRRGIAYILLPEQFSVALYHPRVKLLHQVGRARLYQLTETAQNFSIPITLNNEINKNGITLKTSGRILCRYCENTYYFTDQDLLYQIELTPAVSMTITVPASLIRPNKVIGLNIDQSLAEIEYRLGTGEWKKSTAKKIVLPASLESKDLVIQLRNPSKTSNTYVYALAVELSE